MRTKVIEHSGNVSYNFTEEQTPSEIIEEKLRKKFDKIGYSGGKVKRIFDIQHDKLCSMNLYRNTDDVSYELSMNYKTKLEISYLKPGDILFKGSIMEDSADIQSIRQVSGVESDIKVILKLNPDEIQYNIKQANVLVVDYTMDKIPMYITTYAIYPMYAPITAGLERKATEDIEKPFYPTIEQPKLDKKHRIYIDPLYDMTDKARQYKIVSNLRVFMNLTEEPNVNGIVDMFKNKEIKPIGKLDIKYHYITFTKLKDLDKSIVYYKTHRLYIMYDPSFPIFDSDVYCALIYNYMGEPEEYTKLSLDVFKTKVMDYVNMKYHEMKTIESIVKPLSKLYDIKRKQIIEAL